MPESLRQRQADGWSATGTLLERLLQEQHRTSLLLSAVEAHLQETRAGLAELELIVCKPGHRPTLTEQTQAMQQSVRELEGKLAAQAQQRQQHAQGRWQLWTALVAALAALAVGLLPYLMAPASLRHAPPLPPPAVVSPRPLP